ncbi:MAG: phosphoenolpyruvate--protein phosphotransferase [Chromatiales bacterium 21-64-14]|nr:MAG: phosphoenolpyruvate--protein phosphotransferase [Chromatiales bacterium 21-64-14]HQU14953.1 phosphoenolpyruvate--protein phosphotransferase [Gammaproteobacteria bacterium]
MSLALAGTGVSRGIAIGKAHIVQHGQLDIPEYVIPKRRVDTEVQRLRLALDSTRRELESISAQISGSLSTEITSFLDTHILMLRDSALAEVPAHLIRTQLCNAEWALKQQRDALVRMFDEMEDPYLRSRKDDVDHVVNRVQRTLLDQDGREHGAGEKRLQGCIVLADDLTPADIVLMHHQGLAAFVTEFGGPLSHTTILARSLRIPTIVGVHHIRQFVRDEELLVVDGDRGVVLADLDEASLRHYRRRQKQQQRYNATLARLRGKPAITRDGRVIKLQANIELPGDAESVRKLGADSVGLYRTEFLFMNRDEPPGEDEQFEAYVRVVRELSGAPVTIRTIDLAPDKPLKSDYGNVVPGANPALGLRAIRRCLRDPTLFRPQLRAILRASAHGPVRMMIPMLSNLQEISQALQLIAEAKRELHDKGEPFDPDLEIGGMIEVPAAAVAAHLFAARLDFLSIGTNDLIQYTLAIDRIDDDVTYLYDPLHPAVLQLIHTVIHAGHEAGIPVSMCGEMAGDVRYTRLLLGFGLTEFSMHPASLLEVKRIVTNSDASELMVLSRQLLDASGPDVAEALFRKLSPL